MHHLSVPPVVLPSSGRPLARFRCAGLLAAGVGAALALTAGPLRAAEPPAGQLQGLVRTEAGDVLPGVVVKLEGPEARAVLSGPLGRFRVDGLPAGDYVLDVAAPGFVVQTETRVRVAGATSAVELVLGPAPVSEQVVVSATRGEAASSTLGTSVTVFDRESVADRQASSFLSVVQDAPGVATARTGGLGAQGSMFVRGGESRFARVLFDGVPVNTPGGLYDFGSALPFDLERVEVVRGAVSSLYGTDALAGVVQIVTRRAGPAARPDLRLAVEGGSFSTGQATLASSGRHGRFDWNAGLLRLETDNEVENNRFEQTAVVASLGAELGERATLRVALRAEDGRVGTPGQTAYLPPDLGGVFDRDDLVLGAQLRAVSGRLAHQLSAGIATTDQLSRDLDDSGCATPVLGSRTGAYPVCDFPSPEGFQNDTTRSSLGYQAELLSGPHLLTAGIDVEHEAGEMGTRGEEMLSPTRTNAGLYLQDRLVLGARFFATLGARLERNFSFGWKAVPRVSLAYRFGSAQATVVKASGGAGIKEPDFFQSFGTSFFAQGNPDLKPERSATFDLGVEQRLFEGRLRAEAIWFHHEYKDQIAYTVLDFDTFQGTYVNLGKTRARGLEAAVEAVPSRLVSFRGAYTYTDGEVVVSAADFDPVYAAGQPLLRRPKHQASLGLRLGGERLSGAFTVVRVGERADSDFVGLGLTRNEAYTRVDARLRGRLASSLEAYVVAENLLDAEYQEALGYPALGVCVRGGLRLRLGGGARP